MSGLKTLLADTVFPVEHSAWIIGLSGGVDSVVLLDLCIKYNLLNDNQFRLLPVHLNHQTRGHNSDSDEQLCNEICNSRGIMLTVKSLNVPAISKAGNINFEEAARIERHKLFYEVARDNSLDSPAVLLAHHRDDHLETVLMRLLRGSGIRGLQGIREQSILPGYSSTGNEQLSVFRPLLHITKADIINYAVAHELEWREDRSNRNTDYTRNLVRRVILPALGEIYSNTESELLRLSVFSQKVENNLESQVSSIPYKASKFCLSIDAESARATSTAAFFRLVEKLCGKLKPAFLLPKRAYKSLDSLFKGAIQGTDIAADLHIYEYHNLFYIFLKSPNSGSCLYQNKAAGFNYDSEQYSVRITRQRLGGEIPDQANPNKEYIPILFADEIFKLTLPESSDKFTPIGLSGSQKLSKLLKNQHIPYHLRSKIPVLYAGNTPLWIVGVMLCEGAKLEVPTGDVFCLEYSEKTL